jgi:hypothetical protein
MKHYTDEELLLYLDGECPGAVARHVAEHLKECWPCRVRCTEIEASIGEYVHLKQERLDAPVPSGAGPKAKLRTVLPHTITWPRIGLGLAAGLGLLVWGLWPSREAHLPDARLTPGATKYATREQVCALGPEEDERRPRAELAREVFRQYRIVKPAPRSVEVDYLITPTLGGAEDIRNLWPQPYSSGVWNARVKDALEDFMREKVCSGEMALADAQAEMAKDWVAAYRKYFRTDRPLEAHALFVKDQPWE